MDVPIAGPSPIAEMRRAEARADAPGDRFIDALDAETTRNDIAPQMAGTRDPAPESRVTESATTEPKAQAPVDSETPSREPQAESLSILPAPILAAPIPNANFEILNVAQAPAPTMNATAAAAHPLQQTKTPPQTAQASTPIAANAPASSVATGETPPVGEDAVNATAVVAPNQTSAPTAPMPQALALIAATTQANAATPIQNATKDSPTPERTVRDIKAPGVARTKAGDGSLKVAEPAPLANIASAQAPQQARNEAQSALTPISVDVLSGGAPDESLSSVQTGLTSLSATSGMRPGQTLASQASAHGPPSPAAQTAQHIIRNFDGSANQFEVRLDPPELGRIDVRLEVARDQSVQATISVEQPATLIELARHARDLERALQEAGLFLSPDGLSFDLAQNRFERSDGEANARARSGGGDEVAEDAMTAARPLSLTAWRAGRVDIWA